MGGIMSKFDLERCIRASQNIYMEGFADTPDRDEIIESVMVDINKDGATALMNEYVGMKNYAGFGDQEISCSYGMGPTYGSVVFSIGRTDYARSNDVVLGADELYYLECLRDFKGVVLYDTDRREDRKFNLHRLIGKHEENKRNLAVSTSAFKGFEPDIQAPEKQERGKK